MRIAYACTCGARYRGSVKPDRIALRVVKALAELHQGPGHVVTGTPPLVNAPPSPADVGRDSRKEPSE
jgi:hypothetical protein